MAKHGIAGNTMSRQRLADAARNARGAFVLSATLLYLELAFKTLTTGGYVPEVAFLALLSLGAGFALDALIALLPGRQARGIAWTALLALVGVAFLVELFVFRAFKLYYDPVTVLSGAGDVAVHFGNSVSSLVLSPTGLVALAVFLAPAIGSLALLVVRPRLEARASRSGEDADGDASAQAQDDASTTGHQRVRSSARTAAAGLASCALAALLAAGLGQPWRTLTDRYSFQTCVETFGLLPSLARDAQAALSGTDQVSFEDEGRATRKAKPKDKAKKTRVDTSPNALDLDFEKLAKSADGTLAELDRYVATVEPSARNRMTGRFKGKNLIFISAEAFSAEAIRKDTTPTLWRMWNEGIQLTDYYQFDTAGTTGGECANIFGLLATEGGSSVKGTADHDNRMTMGSLLDAQGYEGWAFHNNTYTYYDRDKTHNNLGYSHGYMGYGNGMEEWVTWTWPQSDLEMVRGTFKHLYGKSTPFNVYYMSVSGHSDYDLGENMMAVKNWDVVKDLPFSDRVKGYLAANVELDRAMRWLLAALERRGMADDTVIVIAADHFPYGLDDDGPLGQLPYLSELYGYDVQTIFQRDHNRPIIWCGSLAEEGPIVVDTPTMSIDLLPTLCNLFDVEWDSRLLPGRDVFSDKDPLVFNLNYDWKTELGTYYASSGSFEAVEGAKVPDGYVDQVNADVANRITYCHGVLTTDYYRHVFGDRA